MIKINLTYFFPVILFVELVNIRSLTQIQQDNNGLIDQQAVADTAEFIKFPALTKSIIIHSFVLLFLDNGFVFGGRFFFFFYDFIQKVD